MVNNLVVLVSVIGTQAPEVHSNIELFGTTAKPLLALPVPNGPQSSTLVFSNTEPLFCHCLNILASLPFRCAVKALQVRFAGM